MADRLKCSTLPFASISSPHSLIRRSSSSASLTSSTAPVLASPQVSLDFATGLPSSAAANDEPLASTSYSPTLSTDSSASTSHSFDVLKSSLRGTLAGNEQPISWPPSERYFGSSSDQIRQETSTSNDNDIHGGTVSSAIAPVAIQAAQHLEANPLVVAFTPPEIIDGEYASAMAQSGSSSTLDDISSSTTSPRKRVVYRVTEWEPLPSDASETDAADRAHLLNPFELARSLFDYIQEKIPALPAALSPRSTSPPSLSPDLYNYSSYPSGAPLVKSDRRLRTVQKEYSRETGTIMKTIETAVGLSLAMIWLAIGHLLSVAHVLSRFSKK